MTAKSSVFKDERGRPAVHVTIDIDAPIDHVWSVLTDFAAMPQWSTTFQGLEGPFEKDGDVTAVFRMFGRLTPIRHPLIYWENGPRRKMFGWSAPTAEGGKITDDHKYIVESLGADRTSFTQSDAYDHAPRLLAPILVRLVRRMYVTFNDALKARAEATLPGHAATSAKR